MLDTQTPLIAEFLKDHQQFSRLLYEISKLLEADELDKARQRAEELNVVAGPHIAYEESELYPRLPGFGERTVTPDQLTGEHHQVLHAVRQLVEKQEFTGEELRSIKAAFQAALRHAEHCGTLITLMARLDESAQRESLAKLIEFRDQGKKWTEL